MCHIRTKRNLVNLIFPPKRQRKSLLSPQQSVNKIEGMAQIKPVDNKGKVEQHINSMCWKHCVSTWSRLRSFWKGCRIHLTITKGVFVTMLQVDCKDKYILQ